MASLSQEGKDKVEFLCNECCDINCTSRKACYENVSRKNLATSGEEISGNSIEISSQGIDEWFSKSKSEEQIKSITLLSEILRLAKYTHNSENIHSTRKNAPKFEYYECPLEIDEKEYNAVISIKIVVENIGDRRIYYHHYLDELKNQTVLNSCVPTERK